MRFFSVVLLLFSVILLNSCIREDSDSCLPKDVNNLILNFDYLDSQGADIFLRTIHRVDVFVYDVEQRLVYRQTVDQASLNVYDGIGLNLAPGTYKIVCWGNDMNRTIFGGVDLGDLFADASLSYSILNPEDDIAYGGEALYYASKIESVADKQLSTVTISEQEGKTEAEIRKIYFNCAHIKIDIYIEGFEDYTAEGKSLAPFIELTHLPASYNFDMQLSDSYVSDLDTASYRTIDGKQLAVSSFYTPFFDENTPIQVLIKKQSDSSTITTISLREFIKENNIKLENNHEVVIPLFMEYKYISSKVSIGLPTWKQIPIEPELQW